MTWDPIWENVFRSQAWGQYPPEHVIRFVARNWYQVPDRKAVRLLDLGSGPGANTWFMAREGFDVAAIDGSSTAINQLESRLEKEGLVADSRVGDCSQLPWPDAWFDGVIDNFSVCHNPRETCSRIVAEVRRVLRPEGKLLSASFTPRTWGYGTGNEVERNAFIAAEGPIGGKGLILFLDRTDFVDLFASFAELHVEQISWTLEAMSKIIECSVVTCRKEC
jgi:ubiquinone/menaquinone biosynthesis C-methylase UbiE